MDLFTTYFDAVSAGDLQADGAQESVLPELERVRMALTAPTTRGWFRKAGPGPKGLYLWGGVGRGKSMLMDMFARSSSKTVRRVHFHAFMQEVHAGIARAKSQGIQDTIQPVAQEMAEGISCLAFDEIQITDITDAMLVGRLFEALFAAGVAIVATSNRHPNDLYKDGLNRQLFLPFIALLQERMVVTELASPTDYRQNRMSGQEIYFSPLGVVATTAMDNIWLELAGGPGQSFSLEVKSRQVQIPNLRNGIARISFCELCGQPLGAADYLALTQEVKVLMLDDIPVLSRNNSSEAKRFVTLIDAVYEAQIGFIASAAAAPEQLYLEGIGSFEFERTASRLREMRANDWGQS
jgi:cell division protein ZapE